MLDSIFTSKDIECPCCGAQGMMVMTRGAESFCLNADKFRKDVSSGEPDVVCIVCDAPAVPVLQSGYN
jgi:hypothetical protein